MFFFQPKVSLPIIQSMDIQPAFGSMEHFLHENPSGRQLTSEEFIKAYDKWVNNIYDEMQADYYISIAKDQISED